MFHNSNIKPQILSNSKEFEGNKLYEDFVEAFYSYAPMEEGDVIDLAQGTKFVFDYFLNKKNRSSVVALEEVQDDEEDIRIVVLNEDMPFIVDSINEFLTKKKYQVHYIINSLVRVGRDKSGKVLDVKKIDDDNDANESIIYIKISLARKAEYLQKLLDELENIVNHVQISFADWMPMLEKVDQVQDWFHSDNKGKEDHELLDWAKNNNFTFLGYSEYDFKGGKFARSHSLGVVKLNVGATHEAIIKDVFGANGVDANYFTDNVIIGKISELSRVHRRTNLDYICVLERKNGKLLKAGIFLGLLSNRLDYQSVQKIPLIRSKVQSSLLQSRFNKNSFNYKEMISIIETLPRDELFQISEQRLFDVASSVLISLNHPKLLLFAEDDKCMFFVNFLIFFPRSRVTSDIVEKIQSIIHKNIKGKFINSNLRFSIMGLAYVHISMKVSNNKNFSRDVSLIEKQLEDATRRWDEKFDVALERRFDSEKSRKLLSAYRNAFPANYRLQFSIDDAVDDIAYLDNLGQKNEPLFNLYKRGLSSQRAISLKAYNSDSKLELHQIMPIIENLGFSTVEENVFRVSQGDSGKVLLIQDFALFMPHVRELEDVKENVELVVRAVFEGKINNDPINRLALLAGLSWRKIFLLDAYCRYMLQIKFIYSQSFIRSVLVKNYSVTKSIVDLFFAMFDPASSGQATISVMNKKIHASLSKVSNSVEDKVLRKLLELVTNTIRTNFFQKDGGEHKGYLSLKFRSRDISDIPQPKPYAEIFVCSSEMEGVHLRGDKISRGGIRWSDRVEDYRTEVLGLMKAQMTKNAIIVPDGAKGVFLVKNQSQFTNQDEIFAAGLRCYKTLLRGMLDITDNLQAGSVIKPKDVICYDEDDPYLVVAADKGTATFSDTANEISAEYDFWLGDAFASGGRHGYDHKKMGITARGAWVSVRGHFSKLGVDPEVDTITAVGIGDMSGDVFGNGLLLSKTLKLVAAFNHIQIFIDPNPDAIKSYEERRRLFKLPRSKWSDYSSALISKGGGVFSRDVKSIKLSHEIKKLLDLNVDSIDPDSLIRAILKARVDLLWNGGIGTYVKSESESHEQIENKSNDNLRINGKDLRCKVVGEGGNLGFTQLGRIEYATNGGFVNTDFIDNSGGVDCSDHEVNIKIAFQSAIAAEQCDVKTRNSVLTSMQPEVAKLVLANNLAQDQSISISERTVNDHFECYKSLMGILEEKVGLNSKLEFLPSSSELSRRYSDGIGLTRPELAVLLAYSKKGVYKSLIESMLPTDKYYEQFLMDYFPLEMHHNFREHIIFHPLKNEIISTVVANNVINHTGIDFFHLAQDYTGLKGCDIARAYSIVWHIFSLDQLWQKVERIKGNPVIIELFDEIRSFSHRAIFWFLRSQYQPLDVQKMVNKFLVGVEVLLSKGETLFAGIVKASYQDKLSYFLEKNVPTKLSTDICKLSLIVCSMDIVEVAEETELNVPDVGKIYFYVGEKLQYDWLRSEVRKLPQSTYWDRMLVKALEGDIDNQHRRAVQRVTLSAGNTPHEKWSAWEKENEKELHVFSDFLCALKVSEEVSSSKLVVAIKQSDILIK